MGIVAWIVLGLLSGLVAKSVVGPKAPYGMLVTVLMGVCGALLGGWVATTFFAADSGMEFFDVATWITAVLGSVVALVAFLAISGSGRRHGHMRTRR